MPAWTVPSFGRIRSFSDAASDAPFGRHRLSATIAPRNRRFHAVDTHRRPKALGFLVLCQTRMLGETLFRLQQALPIFIHQSMPTRGLAAVLPGVGGLGFRCGAQRARGWIDINGASPRWGGHERVGHRREFDGAVQFGSRGPGPPRPQRGTLGLGRPQRGRRNQFPPIPQPSLNRSEDARVLSALFHQIGWGIMGANSGGT